MGDASDCNKEAEAEIAVSRDEVINGAPPPSDHAIVDINPRRRVLHRVPPQLRENKKNIFEPVVVSLGPYHHGRNPQFLLGEQVKEEARDLICGDADKGFIIGKIAERVDDIRQFYGSGGAECRYNDEELSEMMLRDACFVLCYLDWTDEFFFILCRVLGMSGVLFAYRDFYMLENQIPFWLLKLLFCLTHHGEEKDENVEFRTLLCNFLSFDMYGDLRMMRLPWEDNGGEDEEEEPLHLLEAIYLTSIVEDRMEAREKSVTKCFTRKGSRKCGFVSRTSPFGSVRDLKAKGIHFGPSSCCLKDVRFYSLSFYGKLELPIFMVTNNSKVFFSNTIAFEMSPDNSTDFGVTSYVLFMKTLIEDAKDAKELREKVIIYNGMGSDDEVVAMFHSLDTYGFCNDDLFYDVKKRMEEHCNNRAKTWMAELLSTYFRSPWTAIALFAAIFILSLTFIQTYFTTNPIN